MSGNRHPGLDGLRGLAVVAVVLYHVDPNLLPGGFVGVDLFFVLSGYLITSLLLVEHERSGRIAIGEFWQRRVRRLWPLAWLALAAIAVGSLSGVWGADRQRSLPWEVLSAVTNVSNWYQIDHGGYVQLFVAPSPLRHFWSLAIEEQFYLVWPLALAGLLALRRRWSVPAALSVLAVVSTVLGFRYRDLPDRVYLGTDVRMVALVAGAALAWAWRRHPLRGPRGVAVRRGVLVAGGFGAVVLVIAAGTIHADDVRLPTGGFAIIALAATATIAAALSSPSWRLLLGWRPLLGAGRISYAWYLVHWPLLVAIGPDRPLWLRALVALPLSAGVAWFSHVLVERPVIERRVRPALVGALAVVLLGASSVSLLVSEPEGATPTERVARSLETVPDPTTAPTTVVAATPAPSPGATEVPTTTCVPSKTPPPNFGGETRFDPKTVKDVADPTTACAGQVRVLVLGDSTGRGASNGLVALGDPRIQVWDRTTLGCSFGDESCPDWHATWQKAVETLDPDVVFVSTGVVSDLHGVHDAPFMSAEASRTREEQLREAITMLTSRGAGVAMVAPAPPRRPNGLFFCGGRGKNSNCDPVWVARWIESLRNAAATAGATVVDTAGWIAARGSTARDRPDGEHLAGSALVAYAEWLVPQLLGLARAPG